MGSRLETEFGNLAVSEGFTTPEQLCICQRVVDAFEEKDPRKSIDVIMTDRGYITLEQRDYLLNILGITHVVCPHCNKRFEEGGIYPEKILICNHCGKRFEYKETSEITTNQTSSICNKTLTSLQQQPYDLYIGKVLGGKYEILEKIATGGWSTIYKARRKLLNIDDIVAIKILHLNLSDNPQDIKRFYNEAAAIREIRHPNAIHLYDFDRDTNGTIYMAMEFIHGKNLKETIKDTGPFTVERMLHIIFQVCDVISTAHKHPKKIIHRDITPQNIMLTKVGEINDFVKVLDFGIVKLRAQDNASLTGSIVGTPLYMAPEQWRGECDERTDIYSLGVIMYEMLTGKTPFNGDQITLMNNHLNKKPQPFQKLNKKLKIPKHIGNIVFMCLEKNKGKRPQSIDELKSLLQKVKNSSPKFTNYSKVNVFVVILSALIIPLALYIFYLSKNREENIVAINSIIHFHDSHEETEVLQPNTRDYKSVVEKNKTTHQTLTDENERDAHLMENMNKPFWVSTRPFISKNPLLLGIGEIICPAQDYVMQETFHKNKSENQNNYSETFFEDINTQEKLSQIINYDTINTSSSDKVLSKDFPPLNDTIVNKANNINNENIPNGLQNNSKTKTTSMVSQNIKNNNLSHKAYEKIIINSQYDNKIVDNIQKYDTNKRKKALTTNSNPKEIFKNEIRTWLQKYKKALENGDIETLKILGHIYSKKEENKLQQHYSYVSNVKVSIQHETIEINNNLATVSFDRTDEWTDERGSRHKENLPRIIKTLRKENNTWKILK